MPTETLLLKTPGWSNPRLPVLLYRSALTGTSGESEAMSGGNGWPARWRDGIFDYHHFHSTAHEALGVIGGGATVRLGGPDGAEVTLALGDMVVLPAGTGHCLLDARAGFQVFGAYPGRQNWDICRAPADTAAAARISALAIPDRSPLGDPMRDHWV